MATRKSDLPGALDIVVDLGNSLLKGMIQGRRNSAIVVPHAIKRVSREKFDDVLRRSQRGYLRGVKDVDVSMFQYNGQAMIVGENAEGIGEDERRSGGVKYREDYYPYLLMSILLRLIPHGHENIRIMATFPPGDVRFVETLMNSLGGKHTVVRVDGSQIVYKIRQVLVVDEPVAGARCFLIAENGRNYKRKGIDNGLGLCIDIGGKISSLVPFRSDGFVNYNVAESIDLGIQNVMHDVSDILLSTAEYEQYFEGQRGSLPADAAMRECIRSGVYPAGGYELNALDAVADATQKIRSQLRDKINQELGGVRQFSYAVVTGGGGGALYGQIVEHVLNMPQNKIFLAIDDLEQMHLANLFGADNTLMGMLVERRI